MHVTAQSRNPFLRFRHRLDAYRPVTEGRMSDDRFVEIVTTLDDAVASVNDGRGFVETPVVDGAALAEAAGLDIELRIKVEAGNVGGSHKARHLFGTALDLLIDEALSPETGGQRLAIASCGNAALGAAVVAAAMNRPLDVFVPTWADPAVLSELDRLDAVVTTCPRREGEAGDPAYLRFAEAVVAGARPFSVQGTDTPTTFDGGRTLGMELAEQVPNLDTIYIQVGGGALATSTSSALPDVAIHPVQAEGCAPLRRAWDLLAPGFDFDAAAADPEAYMWPWDNPKSLATGILDDITYDWLPLLKRTRETGGEPVVTPEHLIERAHRLARDHTLDLTGLPICVTGTAGLAGLLHRPPEPGTRVGLLFTGVDRG